MSRLRNLYEALSRKKIDVGDDDVSIAEGKNPAGGADGAGKLPLESASDAPQLARVLGLVDLTMLGVGATLGVGVYVLAGSVARNQAGPSVVISFAIAAVTSLFSGLCYSEFASRISKSGSAYNYTFCRCWDSNPGPSAWQASALPLDQPCPRNRK
ncbi:cationic amino acid transporter 3-like isoform X2 [Diaphorina citri]|uniref:Cationic amino acid transporter 3-like isoform X2 n=1 Tax=Diaphorina citri TaxID=121845 RepID=A0A3Q0ISZ4_DIACI|nr:cationic amino acid transporter 3-like isoform X2 [Diaphorina citri]